MTRQSQVIVGLQSAMSLGDSVYIAGPMRGYPDDNVPAFYAMEEKLRALGWDVLNPARMDAEAALLGEASSGPIIVDRDLRAVQSLVPGRDVVCCLAGWENSLGALAEVSVARWLGIDIMLSEVPEVAHLPTDAAERKAAPVCTGVLDYFPDALVEVAKVSVLGNMQHSPGEPLHWDRSKSTDHADALMRHMLERGTLDKDGQRHSAKVAWRALAMLQVELERERK